MAAVEQARSAGQVEQARREVEAVKCIIGKMLVLILILSMMSITSSPHVWDKPEPKNELPLSVIAYARNLYNMTGYNGEAKIYIDRWPEYREYITGEKEIP